MPEETAMQKTDGRADIRQGKTNERFRDVPRAACFMRR